MKTTVSIVLVFLMMLVLPAAFGQSIEQQLVLTQNDMTPGGAFKVAVQVKGTGLGVANTLYSATIDVTFDNTKIQYGSVSGWAFGSVQGYSRFANNNVTAIRIGVLPILGSGPGSDANGPGDPPGYDIGASYVTWVTLNFSILDASSSTSLGIVEGSGTGITLYENHGNSPLTDVARSDVSMSTPIGIDGAPLPITLSSFQALPVAQGTGVKLEWTTVSEINNYGFDVERSAAISGPFQAIPGSFIAGNGTTLMPHAYSYVDNTAGSGRWYYRLKQTDLDRTIHYSDPISVEVTTSVEEQKPTAFALLQNYPNPFNPATTIRFALPTSQLVSLVVYDLAGREVGTLVNGVLNAGFYNKTFDASKLASGVYIYRLRAGNFVETKKLVLVR